MRHGRAFGYQQRLRAPCSLPHRQCAAGGADAAALGVLVITHFSRLLLGGSCLAHFLKLFFQLVPHTLDFWPVESHVRGALPWLPEAMAAATRRLIDLTIADLGDPPGPWAWLALGSQARHEQALGTDQDHALAFDLGSDAPEDADAYFAQLTERVTDGLEAGGIPRHARSCASWKASSASWSEPSMR